MSMVVEPDREERAARIETMARVPGVLGRGLFLGCGVVSTQPLASAHDLAQPALGMDRLNQLRRGCDTRSGSIGSRRTAFSGFVDLPGIDGSGGT